MLTHCFVGYFKLANVQNVHHQPQCIFDKDVQQSCIIGIILVALLVE